MLKIRDLPIVTEFAQKLDAEPLKKIMEAERARTPSEEPEEEARLTKKFGDDIMNEALRQAGKLGQDFIKFYAFYKGISEDEAGETDAFEAVAEICSDVSLIRFFSVALR